jgi:hypothetical protein
MTTPETGGYLRNLLEKYSFQGFEFDAYNGSTVDWRYLSSGNANSYYSTRSNSLET